MGVHGCGGHLLGTTIKQLRLEDRTPPSRSLLPLLIFNLPSPYLHETAAASPSQMPPPLTARAVMGQWHSSPQ